MSSLETQHFISVIENQSSEGREGGVGLQVCQSESLSTCDTFDLILACIPSSPLGLILCSTAVNLSQENPTACTSHGISKFIFSIEVESTKMKTLMLVSNQMSCEIYDDAKLPMRSTLIVVIHRDFHMTSNFRQPLIQTGRFSLMI